jgi:hypothetical protein
MTLHPAKLQSDRQELLPPEESSSHWLGGVVFITAIVLGIVAGVWLIGNLR